MIRLRDLLSETVTPEVAYSKIDELPVGKLFDDAKDIRGIFKMSRHSWNDVIVAYERHEEEHHIETINVSDIHITQPNIQAEKAKKIIPIMQTLPRINVVRFEDGEMAIYDGHHRLVAAWAMGESTIKVNIVTLPQTQYDASGIDTPGDPTI